MRRTRIAFSFALSLALFAISINTYPLFQGTTVSEKVATILFEIAESQRKAAYATALASHETMIALPIPVLGISKSGIADTFGDPRSGGRSHEGVDIFAPRGTRIVSATEGIVRRIGVNELGGNFVLVTGPGNERFYYAHLDTIDLHLNVGDVIPQFALLGTVGTTGNSTGTPPHLHFGTYQGREAANPFTRLVDLEF